ncbi:arylsulfatase [Algibacter lectus]|uniref:Arylsulfatase n=1 Tax=Algibacter lectus TaxID=221126 RepID=A0A090WWF1_9FLAO|nr:arylsulfatase [Algibacter lectus]
MILTDDQGWADVGFNGSTDIPTQNLDRLASQGVVFTNGYVSHPYCSPSRAGLLTGGAIKLVLVMIVTCLIIKKMMQQ